jgi:hypothetical protein
MKVHVFTSFLPKSQNNIVSYYYFLGCNNDYKIKACHSVFQHVLQMSFASKKLINQLTFPDWY